MTKTTHSSDHPQCNICWFEEFGISQHPARIQRPVIESCCFCGRPTDSGIYRRVSLLLRHCPAVTRLDRSPEAVSPS